MRQYVIDELRPEDYENLKSFFETNFGATRVNGIYWIPLENDILSETQAEHAECQPFYFAVDLEPKMIACEFLVRSKNRIRCNCIGYANEKQRNWLIQYIDSIFETTSIIT